jgi:hypothetical protein
VLEQYLNPGWPNKSVNGCRLSEPYPKSKSSLIESTYRGQGARRTADAFGKTKEIQDVIFICLGFVFPKDYQVLYEELPLLAGEKMLKALIPFLLVLTSSFAFAGGIQAEPVKMKLRTAPLSSAIEIFSSFEVSKTSVYLKLIVHSRAGAHNQETKTAVSKFPSLIFNGANNTIVAPNNGKPVRIAHWDDSSGEWVMDHGRLVVKRKSLNSWGLDWLFLPVIQFGAN